MVYKNIFQAYQLFKVAFVFRNLYFALKVNYLLILSDRLLWIDLVRKQELVATEAERWYHLKKI